MNTIIIKCKIVTPMFLTGADGRNAELRPQSIKGAIRFWWRAVQGNLKIKELRSTEAKIFGGVKEDEGKSKISIQIKSNIEGSIEPLPKHFVRDFFRGRERDINLLEYLAYGTYDWDPKHKMNSPVKKHFPAEKEFTTLIHIMDETIKNEVLTSFYLLSKFGGLGAKSRNGFGCFQITSTDPENTFDEMVDLYNSENYLISELRKNKEIPKFSSFSKQIKLYKLNDSYNDWHKCLAEIAKIYRTSRLKFKNDNFGDRRQYIGAPTKNSILSRRAKPYFMHVEKNNSKFDGYILYLPSEYCSGLERDRLKNLIDHDKENENFRDTCNTFNSYLEREMEEII